MADKEMIDRVIKASFNCWNDRRGLGYTVDDMSDSEKEFAEMHAKAIIKAMREPTENMVASIHGCYPDIPDKHAYPVAKAKWTVAIDAILND